MTHNEYQEQISQLIDGELEWKQQPALFTHLSACNECRLFLNSAITLRSKIAASTMPVPQSLDQKMLTSLSAPLVYQFNARPAAFRLAVAASIAFILLMSSLLFGTQLLRTQDISASHEIPAQTFLPPQSY